MDRNTNRSGPPPPASNEQINGYLRDLLRGYNDRDAEATNKHLKTLRDTLERNEGDVITTRFGGSVAKHTFVDGRSDVDVLFIVNNSSLSGQSPDAAIRYMRKLFRQRLPKTEITAGDLAVTVKFADGIVQVLPAIRTKSGFRIADPERGGWGNVVYPERFTKKLTAANQSNQGQVIPTIKLAKPLSARIIQNDQDQISGYHMEALAIKAFANYRGPYDLRSMLCHFYNASATAVLYPIADITGQSRFVDEYMGKSESSQRQQAANHLKTMAQKLNACKSTADVAALFGDSNSGGNNENGGRPPKQPSGGNPPRGNARDAAVRAAPATLIAPQRTSTPPSPYATQSLPLRAAARGQKEYDLTPLSALNAAWLRSNQPGMRYDAKSGIIAGTFALRASWDPEMGRLTANPWHPANPVIEDEYQLKILLRYNVRNAGGIPNRYPPVFETGGRTLGLAVARGLPLADLHMYPDKECCLGFYPAAPDADGWNLPQFFEVDITAWLYRLAYVERFGLERARRELWPEYDHWYGPDQYLNQLRRIAGNAVSSDAACFCGSGVQYAQCHQLAISQCRADGLI